MLLYITLTIGFQIGKGSFWNILMLNPIVSGLNTHSLVQAGRVGVLVLLYNGNNEGDEFGPEVQVLNTRPLFISRNRLRLDMNTDKRDIM